MRIPRDDRCVLYVIEVSGYYKVGITTCFSRRLALIQSLNPTPVTCAAFRYIPMKRRIEIERQTHLALASYRMHGEWFSADIETIMTAIKDVVARSQKKSAWAIYRGDCDRPARTAFE